RLLRGRESFYQHCLVMTVIIGQQPPELRGTPVSSVERGGDVGSFVFQPSNRAGEVAAGDMAEGQGRSERDARPGIVAAHDAQNVIADRIQPVDWLSSTIENACVPVGDQTGVGPEIADDEFDGVIRRLLERRYARV